MLALSGGISAETFTGKLNGHECAHHGETCPADGLDPHILMEPDFVLMLDGGEYVFIPNLRGDIKVRHVLSTVQIDGVRHPKFNSVKVDIFRVKKGDKFVTEWTQEQQDFEQKALYEEGYGWPQQQATPMS